jgi:hypothetical protein
MTDVKSVKNWVVFSYFIIREFLGFQLLFTAIGIVTIWSWQAYSIPIVFWVKVMGLVLQALGYLQFRSNRFMFFYNLGLGKMEILLRVLLLDLMISGPIFIFSYVLLTT